MCGSPQKNPVQVFFLLDDYASWLAQRESRIADLLGLCIEESAEGIRLHLAVVESKYVAAEAAADAKRGSRAQLLATSTTSCARRCSAIRVGWTDLWLARLADLLIDAVIPQTRPPCSSAHGMIRKGTVQLSLRGYSHVFLHSADAGQPDTQSMRAPVEISTPRSPSRRSSTAQPCAALQKPMCSSAIRPRSVNQSMATSRGRCATPTRPQHGSLGPT